MSEALYFGGALAVGGPALWLWQHRRRRRRIYTDLANRGQSVVLSAPPRVLVDDRPKSLRTEFCLTSFVRVEEILDANSLERLRLEAAENRPRVERSFVPRHKKGGTLSYEAIYRHAPRALAVYHSDELRRFLSEVVGEGEEVFRTPDSDQSSCSVLYYTEAGDHIGWHYDHNFYRGRHFTVLIPLVNRSALGGLSASRLLRKTRTGEAEIDTSENSCVVFEGAKVRHCATPAAAGDLRIVLSMTYCTDPRIRPVQELARRIKDTAFFGIRALWD